MKLDVIRDERRQAQSPDRIDALEEQVARLIEQVRTLERRLQQAEPAAGEPA